MISTICLLASMIETALRVRMMSAWTTYTSPDALQLTIVNLSVVPIIVLRLRKDLNHFALPYAVLLVTIQIFHDPATMSYSVNTYNVILSLIELYAATFLPLPFLKSRLSSLAALQILVVVGFWTAMLLVSQSGLETTFMRLDRNMRVCGLDVSCWTSDAARLETLTKELLGHCTIQLMALATIVTNKPKGVKQIGVLPGLLQLVGAWVVVVGVAAAIQGEVPYLSPPTNTNK